MQGIKDKKKRTKVFRHLRETNADVVLLQETHSEKCSHRMWRNEWRGHALFSDGASNARGVAILFKDSFSRKITKVYRDEEGRYLDVTILIEDQNLRILNVYAPNADEPNFFIQLFNRIQASEDDHILIGGDLNIILNPDLDRRGGRKNLTKSAIFVNEFLDQNDWADIWTQYNPDIFQFTWKGSRPLIMSRLDYFLAPLCTLSLVTDVKILPAKVSDHCPIVVTINTEHTLRGPGYWKLNVKHLENKEFLDEVNETFDIIKNRYNSINPLDRWDAIKTEVRGTAIHASHRYASERKIKRQKMENQLNALLKKLNMINPKSDKAIAQIQATNIKIDDLRKKLDLEYNKDAEGAILRSKARWVSEAEHSTKYFYSLEKWNSKNKNMAKIYDTNGNVTRMLHQGKILHAQANFYKSLYSSNDLGNHDIKIKPSKQITNEVKNNLDQPITMEEIKSALKSMARKKSPGISGLPVEFYIVFWTKLDKYLYDAIIYAFNQGILNKTAREGLITLLPKKERDLLLIESWRPIVLLNIDFKLISKIIANRIKSVLDTETGFIKGRQITENLRKLMDIIDITEKSGKDGH